MPRPFGHARDVDIRFFRVSIVAQDKPASGRNRSVLPVHERDPVWLRDVLKIRTNKVVLARWRPAERVRNLEAFSALWKTLPREIDQFRNDVDAMGSDRQSLFVRPQNQTLEQEAVRAANVQEIAIAMEWLYQTAPGLLPTLRSAASAGLLVRILGIRKIELGHCLAENPKVLIAGCIPRKRAPTFKCWKTQVSFTEL